MTYPDEFINKIIQGDCLEVMKEIPDQSIDLVLTDPPYYKAKMAYKNFNDDQDFDSFHKFILEFLNQAKRIGKIVIFPSGKYDTELFLYRVAPPRWRLCWHKGASSNISAVGFNDFELMLVYGDKVCVNQHDHFFVTNNEKMWNYGHPCPKPIGWAKWIVKRFSPDGGLVLDPFSGSGTVAVASKELGRKFN